MITETAPENLVAYLGPEGSNTEIALTRYIKPKSTRPCTAISDVFEEVASGRVTSGFVPLENLLQGPVVESLDGLYRFKGKVKIISSHVIEISHAIGVLKKTDAFPNNITKIYSHPQALAQCSEYINNIFPHAERLSTTSTSQAAKLVSENKNMTSAVIASESTLVSSGFEIIEPNISNKKNNKTRFALITSASNASLAERTPLPEARYVTSLVIDPRRDRQGMLFEILQVISVEHRVNLLSIQSRPDTKGGFLFYLDLEGHEKEERIVACLNSLSHYCLHETKETVEIFSFGSYPLVSFDENVFSSVGIIGGEGKMGSWFSKFFSDCGLNVLTADANSSLSELVDKSQIILLSVPITEVEAVAEKLRNLPNVEKLQDKLIIENCSVKNDAINSLLKIFPQSVEILGIHTMFGPETETIRKENVIITKTERSRESAKHFENFLYKHGAMITHATADEHDKIVSFVQSIIQLCLISIGDVCVQAELNTPKIAPFSTPNSRIVFNTLEKVLRQNSDLLFDLQTINPHGKAARQDYLSSLKKVVNMLETGDRENFSKVLTDIKNQLDTLNR